MAITIQTRDEILNDLRAFLRARQPDILLSIDTDAGSLLETLAEAVYGLQVLLRAVERDAYATTAVGAALDEHAKTRLATNQRKGASSSQGVDAARITGTDGTSIPAGTTMTHTDGTQYETEAAGEIGSAVSGQVDLTITSVTTGTAANKDSGEELTLDTPPAGADATVTLVADVDGAEDQEDDESLRERLLLAYQSPPAGGRFSDYRAWALEVAGVEDAYVYGPHSSDTDGRRGLGTVDVAVLTEGTGANRVAGSTLQDSVQDHVDDLRPAGADFLVIDVSTQAEDIDILIEPLSGYEWDWTGSGTVLTWTPGTKTITWSAALPSSLTDKVDADGSARIYTEGGEPLTVVSYSGVDTVISETPGSTPTGAIYPGGPLSQPILTALEALFDNLGPARGTAADPDQEWENELLLAQIFKAAMTVDGVGNCYITDPVADVTPSDLGAGSGVELIIKGDIVVRPM